MFINTVGDALPELASLSPRIHSEIIGKAMEHNFLLRDNHKLMAELLRMNAELEERVKERTLQLATARL